MKRFLFTIFLMGALVVLIEPVKILVGESLGFEEPATRYIERGDWLSKIADKHYGDTSYWRELALVNRAPNADLIFPEEKVIVPSFEAIQKIRSARSLSIVNDLVDEQQAILAFRAGSESQRQAYPERESTASPVPGKDPGEVNATQPDAMTMTSEQIVNGESSLSSEEARLATNGQELFSYFSSAPFVTGLAVLVVIALVAIMMGIRARNRKESNSVWDFSENVGDIHDEKGRGGLGFSGGPDEERSGKRPQSIDLEAAVLQ